MLKDKSRCEQMTNIWFIFISEEHPDNSFLSMTTLKWSPEMCWGFFDSLWALRKSDLEKEDSNSTDVWRRAQGFIFLHPGFLCFSFSEVKMKMPPGLTPGCKKNRRLSWVLWEKFQMPVNFEAKRQRTDGNTKLQKEGRKLTRFFSNSYLPALFVF